MLSQTVSIGEAMIGILPSRSVLEGVIAEYLGDYLITRPPFKLGDIDVVVEVLSDVGSLVVVDHHPMVGSI